ncbi:hypothetical protein V1264_016409 [Littorina saxatilis]
MEKTVGVQPLESRQRSKLLAHAEKMKRLPDHPLHDKLKSLTKNRLKRKSLNHLVKAEEQRMQADILTANIELYERLDPTNWLPKTLKAEVRTTIPGITVKEDQSDAVLKALTMEEIDKRYPAARWTVTSLPTDQLKTPQETEDVAYSSRNQACPQSLCQHPEGDCAPTTRLKFWHSTKSQRQSCSGKTVQESCLFSDSLSALQALCSGNPDSTMEHLMQNINTLAQTTAVVLQWIPAHTGIVGNEVADRLAKEGSKTEQQPSNLTYSEARTLIRNRQKSTFKKKNNVYNPHEDALHQLTRHEQTIVFRLRTGHCGPNSHLKRIGIRQSALCHCGEADQTPDHFLQTCQLHCSERKHVWPTGTSLHTKPLWGSTQDLEMTAHFVNITGQRI